MPWKRNDPPDPLEERRRQLEEQERALAAQRRRLTEELRDSSPAPAPAAEPPVWRMEEPRPVIEPSAARRRHLARQRQRDMVLFFVFIGLLLIVLVIVMWVASAHNASPSA